jgi:hypothetical protein
LTPVTHAYAVQASAHRASGAATARTTPAGAA